MQIFGAAALLLAAPVAPARSSPPRASAAPPSAAAPLALAPDAPPRSTKEASSACEAFTALRLSCLWMTFWVSTPCDPRRAAMRRHSTHCMHARSWTAYRFAY